MGNSKEMIAFEQKNKPSHSVIPILVALLLFLLVAGAETYGIYTVFTSKVTGASDLFPRWVGARMMFLEGMNPYSEEVTQMSQRGLYKGRLAKEGEDQVAFAYPIYSAYLLLPLIWSTYAMVQAVWMVILQFAVFAGAVLTMNIYRWRPPPWLFAVTCVWVILFYNNAQAILLGQYSIVVFLAVALALWFLWTEHDVLAGAFLAWSTIKPQMIFLLIPAIVIWAALKRRWSVLIGFGVAFLILVVSGLLLAPGWIFDYVAGIQNYAGYTAYRSPVWLLTEYYFPFLGRPANLALTALLLVYGAWHWRKAASWTWEEFSWGIGLAIIITQLIAPRTATANYVLLLLPLFIVFRALSPQLRWGNLYVFAFEIASLFGFWILFAATLVKERGLNKSFENPIMFLPLPLLLFIVFVAARERLRRTANVTSMEVSPL